MELSVGMYVKTEYGISKIVNIFFEKTGTFIETDNGLGNCNMTTRGKLYKGIYILEEDYKTFIDNNVKNTIIDLIEVGDYVNGYYVSKIWEENEITHYIDETPIKRKEREITIQSPSYGGIIHLKNEEIKTIVTKEQMENMKYVIK